MLRNQSISRKLMVIVHCNVPSWNAISPLQTPLPFPSPPPLMVLGVSLFPWGQDMTTHLWRWCGQRDVTLLGDFATALHLRGNTISSLDVSLPHHVTQYSITVSNGSVCFAELSPPLTSIPVYFTLLESCDMTSICLIRSVVAYYIIEMGELPSYRGLYH